MSHRTKRNSKNTYKVLLIFCIQFTLLFCIAYGLIIGKILNKDFLYDENSADEEEVEQFTNALQFTKFMCALILHISV
jgi:hypothetical protein